MKKLSTLLTCTLLVCFMISSSCKKKSDSEPAGPVYPQLIGVWIGYNDQGDTITLKVSEISSALYIYYYKYGISYNEGGYYSRHQIEVMQSTGIVPIIDKSFSLIPDDPGGSIQDTLSGIFDPNALILTGKTKTTFNGIPGTPIIRTDFTCQKQ